MPDSVVSDSSKKKAALPVRFWRAVGMLSLLPSVMSLDRILLDVFRLEFRSIFQDVFILYDSISVWILEALERIFSIFNIDVDIPLALFDMIVVIATFSIPAMNFALNLAVQHAREDGIGEIYSDVIAFLAGLASAAFLVCMAFTLPADMHAPLYIILLPLIFVFLISYILIGSYIMNFAVNDKNILSRIFVILFNSIFFAIILIDQSVPTISISIIGLFGSVLLFFMSCHDVGRKRRSLRELLQRALSSKFSFTRIFVVYGAALVVLLLGARST